MTNEDLTPEKIAETIFYKPATNGQAEQSIAEGAELIRQLVAMKVLEALENGRITAGHQTKLFHEYISEKYEWISSDAKSIARKAWFASAKANGIKYSKP